MKTVDRDNIIFILSGRNPRAITERNIIGYYGKGDALITSNLTTVIPEDDFSEKWHLFILPKDSETPAIRVLTSDERPAIDWIVKTLYSRV